MGKNAEFAMRMDKQLARWDRDVDALAAQAAKASGEARAAYQSSLEDLRTCRAAAQKTFQEIRFASEASGAQLKAGMQTAWETMQRTLEKVSADLKK